MKKISLCLLCVMFLYSCKKEDDLKESNEEQIANEQNSLEERSLDVDVVVSATKIANASVEVIDASEIPETTDKVEIKLPTDTQTAFQQKGLELKVGGTQDFDGVYIRVKDDSGNLSEEVLKVALNNNSIYEKTNIIGVNKTLGENYQDKFSSIALLSKATRINTIQEDISEEIEQVVEINFEGLEPGKFCYAVCIYVDNADGNGGQWVSQPGDVCVEVEAWGGNTSIAGDWNFNSYKSKDQNCYSQYTGYDYENRTSIYKDTCYVDTNGFDNNVEQTDVETHCKTGEEYDFKTLTNVKTFSLNTDGTFYMEVDGYHDTTYDDNSEEFRCFDELTRINQTLKVYGNWAYNEEEEELTVIFFNIEVFENGNYEEIVPEGGGTLWINNGGVTIVGDVLTINSVIEDNDNDVLEETFVISR